MALKESLLAAALSVAAFMIVPSPASGNDKATQILDVTRRLADREYKVRAEASKDLERMIEADLSLIDLLQPYATHKDPEVRVRVVEVLRMFSGLEWIDPAREGEFVSGFSGTPVELVFENRSDQPIRIFWINSSGKRNAWRDVLQPGASATCERSYASHVWLIADKDEKALGIYILKQADAKIIFRGVPAGKKIKASNLFAARLY